MTINDCNYSPTQYAVQVGGASGALGSLALQVLTSNGAGANPSFQANPNKWIKLSTATPSNVASVEFKSLIFSSYKTYAVVFNAVKAVSSSDFEMLISSDNGSNYSITNYTSGCWSLTYNSATMININSTTHFVVTSGDDGTYGFSGTVFLFNFGLSAKPSISGQSSVYINYWQNCAGQNTSAATYNAIKFLFATGNIASGTITLYGIGQ